MEELYGQILEILIFKRHRFISQNVCPINMHIWISGTPLDFIEFLGIFQGIFIHHRQALMSEVL